jgi:hypothetical protein
MVPVEEDAAHLFRNRGTARVPEQLNLNPFFLKPACKPLGLQGFSAAVYALESDEKTVHRAQGLVLRVLECGSLLPRGKESG